MSELYDILVETPPAKVILLALDQGLWDCERSLAELSALCEANHMEAVAEVTQKRQTPETGIVLGSGKLEEAHLAAEELGAVCAVFDGELTGSQIRNISTALGGLEVIDRTMLILEIFRSRAVTNEGKLQTELALLRYRLPRLQGMGESLSRQGGGGGGGGGARRGAGDTKLELDRRHVHARIDALAEKLAEMEKRRGESRKARAKTGMPVVSLVGSTNVGTSSLTNYLVGEKVAIVTKTPPTPRSRITGVITKGPVQYVLMDTPGIHAARNKLDARMTQTAAASLKDVDVTMMLFEPAGEFTDAELTMVKALQKGGPAIAVINKVDLLDNFAALEARKKQLEEFACFDHIVTISAKDGTGCDELFAMLKPYGNEGPHYFDDDAFTDMPEKELVAELVREKALLFLREEVPHGIAVVVERFKERPDKDLIDIDVDIYCERKSHKGMIIGKGGQMLKKIASAARMDIEELLGVKVNLQCWVKVREDWRDNELQLNSLGFAKP